MPKKYTPATFQATIRPSWAGAMSYIPVEEKAKILEAIIKYPIEIDIKSEFWEQTIKPDLELQYQSFTETCEARGRGAKTYWGEHKLSLSTTNDKDKDNSLKDKDKDKSKDKDNNIINEEKFEKFWSIYMPVRCQGRFVDKGSKKISKEKFIKILEKGEDYETIINGTQQYLMHCRINGQLTCGVPVFLNQERWKNDYFNTTVAEENSTGQRQGPRSVLETYAEIANEYEEKSSI